VTLMSEIYDQPMVLSRLITTQMDNVRWIAQEIRRRKIEFVFLAARGTSDNAGLYAKYLWGIHNQLPVALAAPSMFSVYQAPPSLAHALVVGISQSGQSPDIVNVVQESRRQGVATLAITDHHGSPLAQTADFVVHTDTGTEKSVAATKTYTAELMAIAMLSVGLQGSPERQAELERVPELVSDALRMGSVIEDAAAHYRDMKHCVVLGRGFNYATAHEWSLKLKELAYVVAAPYSTADFMHGPVAILDKDFPVLAVAPEGVVFRDVFDLLRRLSAIGDMNLLVLSNNEEALGLAATPLRIAADVPEWLSPFATIVPAQLFSHHLAVAKGIDVEHPRGLQKVTRTW
jgi:glutamine---fructose-6-phosphate transaminase (isomerizing)